MKLKKIFFKKIIRLQLGFCSDSKTNNKKNAHYNSKTMAWVEYALRNNFFGGSLGDLKEFYENEYIIYLNLNILVYLLLSVVSLTTNSHATNCIWLYYVNCGAHTFTWKTFLSMKDITVNNYSRLESYTNANELHTLCYYECTHQHSVAN